MNLKQLKRIIRESIREIQLKEDYVDPCTNPFDTQCETNDDCSENEPVCRHFGECKYCDGAYKTRPRDSQMDRFKR